MTVSREELHDMHPKEVRAIIRKRAFTEHTMRVAENYAQANVAILPKKYALDFMIFCQRNPKPFPVLEVTEPGVSKLKYLADNADLVTDIPQYRVYRHGQCIDEPYDLTDYWRDDLVAFLMGCSATFDYVLYSAGIHLRHFIAGQVPSIFTSSIQTAPAGPFKGPIVVSERPIKISQINQVVQITSRYPLMHGSPVHIGDPRFIGIADMAQVSWGDQSEVREDEIPVFWAGGVVTQSMALGGEVDLMITHYPAKMFISDHPIYEFAVYH